MVNTTNLPQGSGPGPKYKNYIPACFKLIGAALCVAPLGLIIYGFYRDGNPTILGFGYFLGLFNFGVLIALMGVLFFLLGVYLER